MRPKAHSEPERQLLGVHNEVANPLHSEDDPHMTLWLFFAYSYALWNLWSWLDVIKEALAFDIQSRSLRKKAIEAPQFVTAPKVSVVVPACNEKDHIKNTLKALAQQTYKNFEVIVVNDRSTDETGEVMREACSHWPHFQCLDLQTLPDLWLGKTHALHVGAQQASGDYLLFTDADVVFEPQAIEEAVKIVEGNRLDLLVMAPTFRSHDLLLSTMQCFFALILLTLVRPSGFGRSTHSYIGAGAFNLIRKSLYDRFGGHLPLRLEVIDDIMLGKLVAQHRGTLGFVDGKQLISVAWYPHWRAMIQGLEKNFFAGLRYSWWEVSKSTAKTFGLNVFPYLALFVFEGGPFWILACSIFTFHLVFLFAAVKMNSSPWLTLLTPIGALLVWYAQLRSAYLTTAQKGIRWRGTLYKLSDLKRHRL